MTAKVSLKLPRVQPLPDLNANRRLRSEIAESCLSDKFHQDLVYEQCKRDIKYWAERTCWAYDEHTTGKYKQIPLVFWDFQWEMIQTMVDNIWACLEDPTGNTMWNAGADKARKMTATFSGLLVVQWFAQFHGVSTVVTSKSLDEVDKQGDMNTPFERLRWQIEQQHKAYPWLFPEEFDIRNEKHYKKRLINFQNGGQIAGMAPTGKAMRQARAFIWLGDEFAFVDNDLEVWEGSSGTVKVRLIFSTPNGPFCKFYRLVFNKDEEQFFCFQLDWWRHPENAQGLYRKPDGSLSSPFFDALCRRESRQTIAKEWMRDHGESVGGRIYFMFRELESVLSDLEPDPYVKTLFRIWDPGLCFAVGWGHRDSYGRFLWLHELVMLREEVSRNTTLLRATAERAIAITEQRFSRYQIVDLGDPYGSRIQHDQQQKTDYELLYDHFKIRVQSAYLYKIPDRLERRIEVMSHWMTSDIEFSDGEVSPAFLVSQQHCPTAIEAMKTGYRYEIDKHTQEVLPTVKEVHPYIDVMDTMGMLGLYLDGKKDHAGPALNIKRERTKWRATQRRMMRSAY